MAPIEGSANIDLIRAMLPDPETDLVPLFRNQEVFDAALAALEGLFDPELESIPVWRGEGLAYKGYEGFRQLWLDWLEPWATYHVHVDEMIEVGDRVVVLIRDRGRRADAKGEVGLISGSVWTVRNGKIVRAEFYSNREELFEATGVRPGRS